MTDNKIINKLFIKISKFCRADKTVKTNKT